MNIKNLFRRKRSVPDGSPVGNPLRIEGVPEAPMTPEPDDAELAAQALLELMITPTQPPRGEGKAAANTSPSGEDGRGVAYYKSLADKIRAAQEAARLRTLRFLAFVEQELQKHDLPLTGPGSLGLLEAELMKRLDIIERHGGELKTRWQHCVAQVTVRLMQATNHEDEDDNEE